MPDLLTILALAAFVLIFAGLTEGFVSRAPLSFPAIFLGLGYLLGELGVIAISPRSPMLAGVAAVALALVLFLDAVRLKLDRPPREWLMPALVLGPGTILCLLLVALAAHWLFDLGVAASLLLGAVLSSTDPVVMRDIVRDQRIPRAVRETLTLEAATNDVVVLPIVLVTIAVAEASASTVGGWALLFGRLLVLGPAIGFAIGAAGAWSMSRVDRRYGIRREYQALYGMGLVFAAYAGGDGGRRRRLPRRLRRRRRHRRPRPRAVRLLHRVRRGDLRDGDAVRLHPLRRRAVGAGGRPCRSWRRWRSPRSPSSSRALLPSLWCCAAPRRRPAPVPSSAGSARAGWPRCCWRCWRCRPGSPNGETILGIVGVVVAVSVVLHGVSATPLTSWYARRVAAETLAEERVSTASGLLRRARRRRADVVRIEPKELVAKLAGPNPPLLLDVRSRSSYDKDPRGIPGSVRVAPDGVDEWAAQRPRGQAIVAYCT